MHRLTVNWQTDENLRDYHQRQLPVTWIREYWQGCQRQLDSVVDWAIAAASQLVARNWRRNWYSGWSFVGEGKVGTGEVESGIADGAARVGDYRE